jgi:hypothetical protein
LDLTEALRSGTNTAILFKQKNYTGIKPLSGIVTETLLEPSDMTAKARKLSEKDKGLSSDRNKLIEKIYFGAATPLT